MSSASSGGGTTAPEQQDNGAGSWIRPAGPHAPLVWGRTDGVVFGLPCEGGLPGPRGLVRVGVWNADAGAPELVNFIAVEPVVEGDAPRRERMAYSELEPSVLDAPERGKRLWATTSPAGDLTTLSSGIERLSVAIDVEAFTANGAHVHLVASMRSDRPEEVAFTVHHHDDSAPIAEHTLTATMGNYERLRLLWLNDGVVDSRDLYAGYSDVHFVERDAYPLQQLMRLDDGSVLAMCSTDEEDPSSARVASPWWSYDSRKLTQYWRVASEHVRPDLRVRVNGRRVYWAGELEIPGGISFENFEMRQSYAPGQEFVFGLTDRAPENLVPGAPRPDA